MRFRSKILTAGVLAAGLTLVAAAPAFAHDCVVVHRSTQGAVGASHSANWFLLDANQVLAPCATPEQLAQVDAALTDAGLPITFVSRSDKLLKSNGHGIVHASETYFPIILGVLGDAALPCFEE